jgi:hypothetical protein
VLRALTRYGVSEPRIPTDGRARFEINSVRLLEEPLAPGRDGAVLQRWTLAGPLLDSALRIGANSLRAFHTGSGSLHYSARVLRHSDSTPRPAHGGAPISLKRSYRKAWHVLEDGTWKRRTAPLAGKAVKPGDEVVVILEVSSPDGGRYALVEDPIPAGMEYLPRGQVQHGTKETYALEGTEHFEVRDGKAAFFTSSLSRGGNTFVYSLRAETRGRFQARPARVELMYRPEVNAVSRPSAVAVRP